MLVLCCCISIPSMHSSNNSFGLLSFVPVIFCAVHCIFQFLCEFSPGGTEDIYLVSGRYLLLYPNWMGFRKRGRSIANSSWLQIRPAFPTLHHIITRMQPDIETAEKLALYKVGQILITFCGIYCMQSALILELPNGTQRKPMRNVPTLVSLASDVVWKGTSVWVVLCAVVVGRASAGRRANAPLPYVKILHMKQGYSFG